MVGLRCRRGNLYSSLPVPLLVALFLALFAVAPQDIPGSQNESNLSEFLPVDDLPGITENLTPPGNGSPEEFMDVDEFLGANETLLEQNISEDVIIPDENVAEEGASPEENGTEESPAEDLILLDVSLNETLPGENGEIPVPPEGPGLEDLTSENMALLNETSPGMVESPGRFDIPPGWEGELAKISFSLHGSDGKEFPAAITLRRAGSERSFEVRQGIYAHEIPRGKYDISIIPGKISIKPGSEIPSVPVEMAILHGADLSSTEGLSLGLESLSPNSLPFGKNARQAYAIDPSAIIFDSGELTVRAKGKELLKCAEWDFAAQECSGEWIKIMDLTPGELYTIAFNSTDPAYAEYDYNYGAPACNNFFSPCIAGSSLLRSRDSLATPEPNQPNTVDTCADGASGTYMADESVENITITDLNGSIFNAGDWVRVDAYVYCYDGTSDNINFVYSNTSASPVWRVVNYTDPCPAAGFQNISTVFRLDNIPGTHVVRVINQYNGVTTATCGTGAYDDNDDLAFQVNGTYAVQAQDAIIAYRSNTGTNTLNSPKIRFWNSSLNGSWGPEIELPSAGSAVQWAVAKWSPIAYKVAVITLSADGYLDAYVCREKCDLAGSWFYSSNIGSVGNAPAQRRFDFEFETTTGDLVVVYGINSTVTTQDLAYKVLPANQTTFSGIPEQYIDDGGHATDIQYTWVRMDRNPTLSEEMILAGFDSTDSDINAWVWNGSVWRSQVSITDTATATGGYEALAVRYAADGSKGMAIGGSGTAGAVNTRYWNGTAWSAITTFDVDPGDNQDVRWANLKADPSSDDLQGVFIDSGSDLATAYWSGSAWTVTSNIDTAVDTATARCADFEWNASGSVGRLVWDTDGAGTTLSQRVCAPQCTATTSTISTYAGTGAWITMWRNPSFPSSQVRILSARLNSNFDIGSFLFNGTAYANYGDGAITADTTVSTYEAYSIAFNITDTVPPSINFTPPTEPNGTVIYVNYTFINTSITDNMGVYAALLEWNGTNESMNFTSSTNWYKNKSIASYGIYAYKVWARDYVGNWNVSETRTIIYGSPPSVVVIDPHGEAYPQDYYVPIAINATDPDGISLAVATVTLPNGSTENVTLYYSPTGDNFGFNTIGIGWVRENLTGPGQTCISDINDTVPEQAYISLSGNGLPETDTLCTLISHNALYGNFDMEITFTLLPNLNADTAINFQLTEQQTSAEASKMAFIALSNWTGLGRNYEVFADDGNQSGYLSTRETEDTHGKFRITRSNNTFTFYTWNNSGSSWTEEASSTLNLSKALFVSFEAESAYPGWGTISASFDNLSISGDNYTYSTFNNTNLIGLYNISFYVRDSMGAVNNSERTNFTVYFANHRPSKPFILAPSIGSYIYELFNITWSTVTDEEGDNVLFNITLLNPDYSFNQTIISDYGNLSTNKYEWDTSTVPDGVYSLEVLVYENETPEQLSNYYVLPGTFTVNNSPNVPPSLIILSPLGENYTDFKPVPLAANITDIDGINESYAIVTYPNGSTENITLYKCRGGDNFDMDTVGLGWFVENSTSPSQTCIADINTTIPGKAYTYISGNGAPMSDTLCSLVSHRGIYGDFDMNISFEILSSTSADNAFNFQVMEVPSSANATFLAFIALSNWTGMGRNYEVFVDDGTISGYIATVPTNDTYGKFRIKREGNNFTFYVWNNTGSSWIELNSTELNLIKSLHVAIESESAYPGWGSMEVAWDNLTIAHDNDTFFNEFNTRTHAPGDYNVSFYARDNRGGINDTEKSNFTVVDENDPPSKPFLLTPSIGSTVSGLYNITWSAVYDPDGNSVWFNITLLNPDGSDNATIVSDYGNISINHYTWDTTAFPDGEYSMRIVVFENETPEHLSNSYTLPGTFVVHNSVPYVEIINPHGEDYQSRRPVPLVINASSAIGIDTAVAEVTLPNGSVENLTLGSGLQGDNFSTDTMGNPWFVEDSSIGHSQNCIADIDTTIPGRAYTYLYGDGTPQTDTLCSIISNKAIYGDFDISISFNVESEAGADYALNFQVSRRNASAGAQRVIFFALSNWTGLGRNYEVFVEDGNQSGYLSTRETEDTHGKFRITRSNNTFTFYTWNNSGSSWVEENVSQNEFDFAGAVYVTFESESAYPGWGAMEASWDNFTVEAENYTMGMFWGTETPGVYNVTFAVNDTYGGTNATEKTNFTIVYYNSPPGTPYLLAPWPGENVSGVYQITWSEVANFDDDNLQFNITLLNADFSYNSTIATNYGNKTSTSYDWDTSTVPDGIYSMEITVFENETPEQYSNSYTMLGNFTIENGAPAIANVSAGPDPGGFGFNVTITANVTGADTVLVGITPPGGTETNYTMVSYTQDIYEYAYSGWVNGTYAFTIYATDLSGKTSNYSSNFTLYQNLTIQVRTISEYYNANQQINITDPPGPAITEAYVAPDKVVPGDTMHIYARVYDSAGIRGVTAYMQNDLGEDAVPLSLSSGDSSYGLWEADWAVHDTSSREYSARIVAENSYGQASEMSVAWWDPPGFWILPNGDDDPTGLWTNRSNARDGNTDTYSSDTSNPGGGWGSFLYFNTSMIKSDRVRVWTDYDIQVNAVDIDVYNGTWVDVYEGPITNLAWFEANFSEQYITGGRFRFNYTVAGWVYWLYEFQFYNITTVVNKPSASTQEATSVEETSAILHGIITTDGGTDCQMRFLYGNTTSLGSSTSWHGPMYTGDQLGIRLTGLENGQTYYYIAQVNNSAGVTNGSIISFTTGPAAVGWVTATGYENPSGMWEQEEYAFDDLLLTSAQSYHAIGDANGVWSAYLYLNRTPPVFSDRLRFNAKSTDIDLATIDIYNGSSWTTVFNNSFAGQTWILATFNQTNVSQARIRFRVDDNNKGLYWRLYEFDFFKGSVTPYENQSLLYNNGETNASCYLLMKTQFWNGTAWEDDDVVVNDTSPRQLTPMDIIKLDSVWNPMNYSTNNLSFGDGTYRIYAACLDNESNVLMNIGGDFVNDSYNFIYDTTPPSVIIVSPINGSDYNLTDTIPILVNITDMLGVASAQANVSNALGSELVSLTYNSSSDLWEYPYSNTNYVGVYTIRIIATGLGGNVNGTEFVQVNVNDVIAPTVVLVAPPDLSNYSGVSVQVNFTCNATDDYNTNNISLYITNSTNQSFSLNATVPVSGVYATATFQLALVEGNYTWNCDAYDSSGNRGWGPANRTLSVRNVISNCEYLSTPNMFYRLDADLFANKTDSICITIEASNITLDCAGHNITGVGGNTTGIALVNSSGVRIENCMVGNYSSAFLLRNANNTYLRNNTAFNSKYGFLVDPSYNNTIIENQMFNNSAYGLYLENSHNNTIRNNTAWNNSLHGFFLNQSTNNILSNNTAYNNSQHGVYIYYSNFNNLTNNTARNNANAGFQIEFSNNNSLDWNLAHDDYNGFYVQQSSQNNLTNNDAYNNTYDGFYLDRCSGNLFQFNHVYDNANVGFDLDQSTDMVLNNTMYGHIDGLYVYESSGNVIAGNIMYGHDYAAMEVYYSENNTIANNSVLNSTSYGFLVSGARNTILSGNYVQDIGQFDALSIAEANNSIIENNIAHNATNNCFGISYSSNVTASNNTASACNAGFNVIEIYGSSFSNNTANESAYGFYVDTCSNNTFSGSVAYNNSLYGFYLYYLNLNNISGNIARNNTGYGIYFNASGSNSLIGNNITWNGADGLLMAAESDSNSLYSNYVCFNNGIDLRNQNATNSGDQDTCDSHFLWDENGHPGCTYMCTEVWHRFMGNVSGNILLAPSSAEIFYSWVWNGQHGRVYAANGDASIQWINLTALGRNTSGLNSTHDFEELDFLLGYENLAQDNVNATFSSDGSNPKETATMRIFKRDVPFIPVAQSAWNSSFRTGIVWDASQGGPQFNTTLNQDVVFVVEMNTSQDYNYQIMVPGTLDTYKGGSGVINIWVELD